MKPEASKAPESVTANLALSGADWQLRAKVTVPAGPTRLRVLLPMVQALTDQVVDAAVKTVEAQGHKVSCQKGCGACCRQLVPIAEEEARRLHDLIQEFPEPRRTEVQNRFQEARRRLEEAGLLEKLRHPEQWVEGESRQLGLQYFAQGIACPFLEEESCSIYLDRPVACREYLVTTPAANCARPTADTVQCVPLSLKVSTALMRIHQAAPTERSDRWVPLILAPEWAEAHPEGPSPRPGLEWVQALVKNLIGKEAALSGPPQPPGSVPGKAPA
jgi:Fe-S-cluster containining protein